MIWLLKRGRSNTPLFVLGRILVKKGASDLEGLPSTNNYRTHKVITEIDLIPASSADTAPEAAAKETGSSLDADISQNDVFVKSQEEPGAVDTGAGSGMMKKTGEIGGIDYEEGVGGRRGSDPLLGIGGRNPNPGAGEQDNRVGGTDAGFEERRQFSNRVQKEGATQRRTIETVQGVFAFQEITAKTLPESLQAVTQFNREVYGRETHYFIGTADFTIGGQTYRADGFMEPQSGIYLSVDVGNIVALNRHEVFHHISAAQEKAVIAFENEVVNAIDEKMLQGYMEQYMRRYSFLDSSVKVYEELLGDIYAHELETGNQRIQEAIVKLDQSLKGIQANGNGDDALFSLRSNNDGDTGWLLRMFRDMDAQKNGEGALPEKSTAAQAADPAREFLRLVERIHEQEQAGTQDTSEADWFGKQRRKKKNKRLPGGGELTGYREIPQYQEFTKQVKNCHPDARKILEKTLERADILSVDDEHSRYYVKDDYIQLSKNALPSTLAHEAFHRYDMQNGIFAKYKFGDVLRKEYEDMALSPRELLHYMRQAFPDAFERNMEGGIWLKEEYRGISDILSGLTRNQLMLGYRHKNSYWGNSDIPLGLEAWAQMGRILYENNPKVIEMLRKLFPKFYAYAMMAIEEMK